MDGVKEPIHGVEAFHSFIRSVTGHLEKLDQVSRREMDGGAWFANHPIPTASGLEQFVRELEDIRSAVAGKKLNAPTGPAELAIWLRAEGNQRAFLEWFELNVKLTEKLSLGCSAAIGGIAGYKMSDFQDWPFDTSFGIDKVLQKILDASFDVTILARDDLKISGSASPHDFLIYKLIPAMESPEVEIKAVAKAVYLENYGTIEKTAASQRVKTLLTSTGSPRAALEGLSRELTASGKRGFTLASFPTSLADLKRILRDTVSVPFGGASYESRDESDWKLLLAMTYVNDHLLESTIEKQVGGTQVDIEKALS